MANDDLNRDGDPRLTAYALGELSEAERAEISARLAESPDDRRLVDDIQRLGGLLRQSMATAPRQASSELRSHVLQQLAEPVPAELPPQRPRFSRRRYWLPLSLAASLMVMAGTLYALVQAKHRERAIAQNDFIASTPSNLSDEPIVDEPVRVATEPSDETADEGGVTEPAPAAIDMELTATEGQDAMFDLDYDQARRPRGSLQTELFSAEDGNQDPSTNGRTLVGGRGLPDDGEHIDSYADRAPTNRPTRGDFGRRTQSGGQAGAGDSKEASASSGRGSGAGERQRAAEGEARDRDGTRVIVQEEEALLKEVEADGSVRRRSLGRFGGMGGGLGTTAGQGMGGRMRSMGGAMGGMGGGMAPGAMGDNAPRGRLAVLPGRRSTFWASNGNGGDFSGADAEDYSSIVENPFRKVTEHPLSTFSIDVDTASYANVRRFLNSHALPPPGAVRIEELVNYVQYDYPQPDGPAPFSVNAEVARCPWNAEHRLLRVGLKGREVAAEDRPASNLVFLLDVSGSMDAPNKLPLVKEAMQLLTDKLTENDRVAIVVYAGNSGMVLPSTNGDNKQAIHSAIAGLVAGGSTNGGQGLQMAYDAAQSHFIKGGTNRVILATDGDFNVGVTSQDDLVRLIEEKAKSGVFLSALGFGVGNLKDSTLEKLADKGNGNYAYIDTLAEARKVLVEQLSGTLVTIAKDVKIQIEFNPAQVGEFRLIGYEDRILAHQDFNDDRKDAGEVGAGHTVTALYELSPAGQQLPGVDRLKYQRSEPPVPAAHSDELATIKLRYKEPEGDESRLIEHVVARQAQAMAAVSGDFQFAAAVAAFGMVLRDSVYRGEATYEMALELAQSGLARDANGYRSEFVQLVRQAREIAQKSP